MNKNKLLNTLVTAIQDNKKFREHMEEEWSKCASCSMFNEKNGTCKPLKTAAETRWRMKEFRFSH